MNLMTFNPDDTICAVSTAPGVGGVAIVRISGSRAIEIADKLWRGRPLAQCEPRKAYLGNILDSEGEILDNCLCTVFRGPASFTGDDVVEISVHGSRYIQQELVNALISAGCRLAMPGEFTHRAFAAGRIDLAEAEGIADVIDATTRASHRLALNQMRGQLSRRLARLRERLLELSSLLELELDFSEEEVEFASRSQLVEMAAEVRDECQRLAATFSAGSALKDGIPVAIIGEPNVGKSTLLNRLVDDERAIVSDIPGTTRDTIEDTAVIDGTLFRFVDTAGLRDTADVIETMGIERSVKAAAAARVVVYVIDATQPADVRRDIVATDTKTIFVLNKCDRLDSDRRSYLARQFREAIDDQNSEIVALSARDDADLSPLIRAIVKAADPDTGADDIIITNARHYQALKQAAEASARMVEAIQSGIPSDFVAQDLRETLHHLGTITGAITPDDILATIFSRFCIGK